MGNILGGESSGGSVGGRAYRGLGDLPFQEDFTKGSFGAFQI